MTFYYAKPRHSKRLDAKRVVWVGVRCYGVKDHTIGRGSLSVTPASYGTAFIKWKWVVLPAPWPGQVHPATTLGLTATS